MAVRFDRGSLQGKAEVTDEGYVKADAIVTRTGVLLYRNQDGSLRRELRHPDDVFANESLASLRMVPVTLGHPPVERPLLDSEVAKEHSVGHVGDNVRPDGKYVLANFVVTDGKAVQAIQAGRRELSLGYTADRLDEKGTYQGSPYDCRQTNIRYNHLSIVDTARVGGMARINLDAADAEEVEEMATKKVSLDGKEHEVPAEVADALVKSQADLGAEKNARKDSETALRTEADTLKAKRDELQAKLDAKPADTDTKKAIADGIKAGIRRRIAVVDTARRVLPDSELPKLDDMSDDDIRKAVVKHRAPKLDLSDKSEVYLQVRFDAIAEEIADADPAALERQRKAIVGDPSKRSDSGDPIADAQKRMQDRMRHDYMSDAEKKRLADKQKAA